MNDRFLRALKRQPVDRRPVWIMRQAGRYLPEYRQVRAQAGDFMSLCRTPELACEVTLQPIRRFGFDAAILFSDILTIPDALGLGLYFTEGEGPKFQKPLKTESDIRNLKPLDINDLNYVPEAVSLIKQELAGSIPLIGFAGSPWTLACYMVEGGASKNFHLIKKLMYQSPELLTHLLDHLAQSAITYLSAQIEAGADVVMLFDSWGGVLSTEAYKQFSLDPMQKIIAPLKKQYPDAPVILFTKGGGLWLELMLESGYPGGGAISHGLP